MVLGMQGPQPSTVSKRKAYALHADVTTAIGEPKPGPAGRVQQPSMGFGVSSTTSFTGLIAMGAGVGLVFGLMGKLLG